MYAVTLRLRVTNVGRRPFVRVNASVHHRGRRKRNDEKNWTMFPQRNERTNASKVFCLPHRLLRAETPKGHSRCSNKEDNAVIVHHRRSFVRSRFQSSSRRHMKKKKQKPFTKKARAHLCRVTRRVCRPRPRRRHRGPPLASLTIAMQTNPPYAVRRPRRRRHKSPSHRHHQWRRRVAQLDAFRRATATRTTERRAGTTDDAIIRRYRRRTGRRSHR